MAPRSRSQASEYAENRRSTISSGMAFACRAMYSSPATSCALRMIDTRTRADSSGDGVLNSPSLHPCRTISARIGVRRSMVTMEVIFLVVLVVTFLVL